MPMPTIILSKKREKTMQTIVVNNRKGGVGKTFLTTHIAAGLTMSGARVCIVDTDPQGHSGLVMGIPKHNGVYNMMTDDTALWADNLRQVPREAFVPSGFDLHDQLFLLPSSNATQQLASELRSPLRFRSKLAELGRLLKLDYILIDTSPSNSLLDGAIMIGADWYLYPTEASRLSFDGLSEALGFLHAINEDVEAWGRDPIQVLGIIPNKVRGNTLNHRTNLADLQQAYPDVVWGSVQLWTAFETATEYAQLMFAYEPFSTASIELWGVVARVCDRVGFASDVPRFMMEAVHG